MAVGDPAGWAWPATRATRTRRLRSKAGIVGVSLLLAACGSDDGEDDDPSMEAPIGSTTADTGLPSCADVQHGVVFSIFGTATIGDGDEAGRWMNDPSATPVARPGAADVVSAYLDLGYEVLYVTSVPGSSQVGDQPLEDAITVWLGENGFPVGEETRIWSWDGEGEVSVAVIEELARLSNAGVELDAGYASDPDVIFPLVTGGVPGERLFTVGAAANDETSTSLPDEDLGAHLPDVEALDPVCE